MNKLFTLVLIFTFISGATLSYAAPQSCDLRVGNTIKVDAYSKKLYDSLEGRFDSTSRKWWVDGMAVIAMLSIGGIPFGAEWFNATAKRDKYPHDKDMYYLDGDNNAAAVNEFTKLKNICKQELKKFFPHGTITNQGNLFYNNFLYKCSEPGVNGTEGGFPEVDAIHGDGHQYFINIYRYDAREIKKDSKQTKCKKLENCLINTNSAAQYSFLNAYKLKLGCY